MLKKKWLVFISLFLAGACAGAAVALPFCPDTLSEEARVWATMGEVFIILLAIAIPLSYLILMAVGALQITRPPQVIADAHPGTIHTAHRVRRVLVTAGGGQNARLGIELAARIAEEAIYHLEAPVVRVAGWDAPYPPFTSVEHHYRPDARRVLAAVREVLE